MGSITLRELYESIGVSRRTIQRYESLGLVCSTEKNHYGHLMYNKQAQERVRYIKMYQDMGFKLKEIREIIDEPKETVLLKLKKQLIILENERDRLSNVILEMEQYIKKLS